MRQSWDPEPLHPLGETQGVSGAGVVGLSMSLLALNFFQIRESTKRTLSFLRKPFRTLPGQWGSLAVGEVDTARLRKGGFAEQ